MNNTDRDIGVAIPGRRRKRGVITTDYAIIKQEMKKQKVTQEEMARELNCRPNTMCWKLKGNAPLEVDEAVKICSLLNIKEPRAICEALGFEVAAEPGAPGRLSAENTD